MQIPPPEPCGACSSGDDTCLTSRPRRVRSSRPALSLPSGTVCSCMPTWPNQQRQPLQTRRVGGATPSVGTESRSLMEVKPRMVAGPVATWCVPQGMVFDSSDFRSSRQRCWLVLGAELSVTTNALGSDADTGWPRLSVKQDLRDSGGSIPSRPTTHDCAHPRPVLQTDDSTRENLASARSSGLRWSS